MLLAGLALAVPRLGEAIEQVKHVDGTWIALAAMLELRSSLGYALSFQHVFARAPRHLAADSALSELAFGAVVPVGGAGGIAIGTWVVKAKGGSLRAFLERSAVLFLLASAINVATLAVAGLLVAVCALRSPHNVLLGLGPAAIGIATVAALLSIPRLADRATRRGQPEPGGGCTQPRR